MTVTLAMLVFLANEPTAPIASTQVMTGPAALADCFKAAALFVTQDPAKFNGVALGAGCIVQKPGKPA